MRNGVGWVLRLGVAGDFIGHGWVGTGRPSAWLPYFHLFGVSDAVAFLAMPMIGLWDIFVGVLVLASFGVAGVPSDYRPAIG
jgi:hypothetical protein